MTAGDIFKEYMEEVLSGSFRKKKNTLTPFNVSSLLMRDVYYEEKINKKMNELAERGRGE